MENVGYCFQKYNKNLFSVGWKPTFLTRSSTSISRVFCESKGGKIEYHSLAHTYLNVGLISIPIRCVQINVNLCYNS